MKIEALYFHLKSLGLRDEGDNSVINHNESQRTIIANNNERS